MQKIISLNGEWSLEGLSLDEGLAAGAYRPEYRPADAIPAQVPGIVQNHLLEAGRIEDPYWEKNNEKILWVEEKEWWYRRTLEIPSDSTGRRYELLLDGITYKAEVWLDGITVGTFQGTFKRRVIDITSYVEPGGSYTLTVRTRALERSHEDRPGGTVKWGMVRSSGVVAPFTYWWNWSPHMVPIGLWRGVSLKISGGITLADPQVRTAIEWNECEEAASARVAVAVAMASTLTRDVDVQLRGRIRGVDRTETEIEVRAHHTAVAGETRTVELTATIERPKLWWPNGMGEHPLYAVDLELLDDDGECSDRATTEFGVREITFEKNPDDLYVIETSRQSNRLWSYAGNPYPWIFVVNRKRLFIRGSNWVPMDNLFRFLPERYTNYLDHVEAANLNMLRVWGGGIQETETFYRLCNRKGILCWTEFWFACANYPVMPHDLFLENAVDMVKVLRNHPAVAMWSGGNEYNPDSPENKDLVDKLAGAVAEYDPDRSFRRGSPYKGDRHGGLLMFPTRTSNKYSGDILHGDQRKTLFRAEVATGRSTPVLESVKRFIGEDKLWPVLGNRDIKDVWEYHHAVIAEQERDAREYGATGDLEHWIYAGQIVHGLVHRHNIEYSRLTKWQSSGCMQWQVQASWPTMHREMIDWYGVPKPVFYFYKRASRDLLVALDLEKYIYDGNEPFEVDVFAVSDRHRYIGRVEVAVRIYSLSMELLHEKVASAVLGENESINVTTTDWRVPADYLGSVFFVSLEMARDGEVLARNLYWVGTSHYTRKERCLNLNGPWRWQVGREVDEVEWNTANLPSYWALPKRAPDEGERVFYRRRITIPAEWEGTEIELFCQGFEGDDVVFFNGTQIGATDERVPDTAKAGAARDSAAALIASEGEEESGAAAMGLLKSGNDYSVRPNADPIVVPNLMKRFYAVPAGIIEWGGKNTIEVQLKGAHATGISEPIFIREASTPSEQTAVIELDNRGAYLAAVRDLPEVDLDVEVFHRPPSAEREGVILFRIENRTETISFLTDLRVDGGDEDIRPLFDDNYFALLPGEERDVHVVLRNSTGFVGTKRFTCRVTGWNTAERRVGDEIPCTFGGTDE